jgi:electron transport complex protein RnfB
MSVAGSRVAWVREADCIGCARCIDACPVDAIVGAAGFRHTVVASWCTGCDECLPVCPTSCIETRPRRDPGPTPAQARVRATVTAARRRRAASRAVALELVDVDGLSPEVLRAAVRAAVRRQAERRAGPDAEA